MSDTGELPVAEVLLNACCSSTRTLKIAQWDVVCYSHASPDRASTPNEDAAACFQADAAAGVLIVADGVGGHQSGEVASELAVRHLHEVLRFRAARAPDSRGSLRNAILDALERADRAVADLGVGAATTAAIAELNSGFIRPYHVGDSLITLVSRRGRVKWQSVGHAPLDYAVEAGVMDELEAMIHPERHIVSNVVGQADMSISVGPRLPMAARDTLLLCSDGLSDNVSTEEAAEILRKGTLQESCDDLIRLAQERMRAADPFSDDAGKPDDLTLVACRLSSERSSDG